MRFGVYTPPKATVRPSPVLFDEAVNGDFAANDERLAALQATLPPRPKGEVICRCTDRRRFSTV